jgi:hypothetical protein
MNAQIMMVQGKQNALEAFTVLVELSNVQYAQQAQNVLSLIRQL